ncbi:hypothetical protein [Fretibacterium fastidiosum]|uniref:Haemolysin XhlA n=1 Tax=Fretibacterium fastidiosum TaxID=651822 RepID=A0AB94IXW8_9BACT|nr:hypothetical protein [Fretibacterium fastidiosum]CBL28580.1 hypothetical protein SY1_15940 [Fretibacterium fastidiosum]
MERLIETMRGIVGALNAHGLGLGDGVSLVDRLARLETRLDHLEKTLNNTQKILVGLAISVLTLLIKMAIEGLLKR